MNRLFNLKSIMIGIVLSVCSTFSLTASEQDVYDLILERIRTEQWSYFKNSSLAGEVGNLAAAIKSDGAFPDINYADKAQSGWTPVAHLDRVKKMAIAYTKIENKYYQSAELHKAIVNALNYWYTANPISSNWYNQQIGCPQRMGLILIVLRSGASPLPADLEAKLIARMETIGGRPDQGGSQGTGANKTDIAIHWVYRACLTKSKSTLDFAIAQVYYPLFYTAGEGFQHDYSYMQHGQQLYLGGYGNVIIGGIANIATHMRGTEYAVAGENLDVAASFLTKTFLPIIRGQHFHYNVSGRSLSRPGSLYQGGVHGMIESVKALDPVHTEEYNYAIERVKRNQGTGYGLQPTNRVYWRSDYTLHQRPEFSMDVRLVSTRTLRNENGNGENIKGYFLSDGAYDISIDGDEYVDIFPTWDWTLVPGVTAPARLNTPNNTTGIPKPGQWGTSGSSSFVGGVSDGKYGAVGYAYSDFDYSINTSAKKAWFFFDKEVVCLGANIKSSAPENIRTSINQCLSKGDVIVAAGTAQPAVLTDASKNFTDLKWMLHNRIGYYFPKGGAITIANQDQTGTWKSINDTESSVSQTKKVFNAWLDHGVTPKGSSYQYIIVPNITQDQAATYNADQIKVLANTDELQVVEHTGLKRYSLIFYKPGLFQYEDITIEALNACAIMVENIDQPEVKLHLSDPKQVSSVVRLNVKFPQIADKKFVECKMPASPHAGSTIQVHVNRMSADFIPENKTSITAIADTYVRGGSYASSNFGTESGIVVKKDDGAYQREGYLKFDLKGVTLNSEHSAYLSLYMNGAGVSITSVQWEIRKLNDDQDGWSETGMTWNNRPTASTLLKTVSTVPTGEVMKIDLTEAIRNELELGNQTLSIYLKGTTNGTSGKGDGTISSRETSVEQNRPQLYFMAPLPRLKYTSVQLANNTLIAQGEGGYTPYVFELSLDGKVLSPTISTKNETQFAVTADGDYRLKLIDGKGETISRDVMISKGIVVEPVLTFAALTDLHFGRTNAPAKVAKALSQIKASSQKVDAIFVSGDLTDNGLESQYNLLKTTFDREMANTDIKTYFCLGNHDRYNDKGSSGTLFQSILDQPLNQMVDVKGYPFLLVSMENSSYTGSYVDYSKQFVEQQLPQLSEQYSGKPIFLFAHMPIANTIYGSYEITGGDSWGNANLQQTCAPYPQLVFFSGHSHYPMDDERSIHQKDFTSIGLASLAYLELEPKRSEGIHPEGYNDNTESAIVTVYSDGSVKVKRINVEREVEIKKPWIINAPHDGSQFKYTDSRNGGEKPHFEVSDAITINPGTLNFSGCQITFPQAKDDDMVHRYTIEAVSTDKVQISYSVYSRFYITGAMPETLTWSVKNLLPSTKYRIRIKAIDSFGLESEPLLSEEFTTSDFIVDPNVKAPEATLFDLNVRKEGAADISESRMTIENGMKGLPTTLYDAVLKQYIARFSGDKDVFLKADYKNNQAFKDKIAKGFSMEVYTKTTTTAATSSFSSQQTGGFGVEQASNAGPTKMYAYINGDYKVVGSVSTHTQSNEYYHMVFTYDKASGTMKAFYNAVPGGEATVSGNLTFASNVNGQWLCVGGDASIETYCQAPFTGDVVFARMYDNALSQDEVYRLYEQVEARKTLTKVDELNRLLTVTLPQMVTDQIPGATRLLEQGWQLMGRLSTTDQDIETFKEKVENPEAYTAPRADLLDVKFRPDSEAIDISDNHYTVGAVGTQRTVLYNPAVKQYLFETKEDKNNFYYFNYAPLVDVRDNFKNGFTAELYCKTFPAKNNGKTYSNPIGATEVGGWNFETNNAAGSGLMFYFSDSPTYPLKSTTTILTTPEAVEFHHVMMVFDKASKKVSGYIDGKLVVEKTDAGLLNYREPAEAARWLCIGGDAGTSMTTACQAPHWGEIGLVRLYKNPLTYDDVIALYDQTEARKKLTKMDDLNTLLTSTSEMSETLLAEGWALIDDMSTTDEQITNYLQKISTSIGSIEATLRKVWIENGMVRVSDNAPYQLFSIEGRQCPTNVPLSNGVYFVRFSEQRFKIVVD